MPTTSENVALPRDAVVVGVDGGAAAMRALDAAAEAARRHRRPLHVLHATHTSVFPWWSDERLNDHEQVTFRCRERAARVAPDVVVTSSTEIDEPARALVRASRDASLVVVGAGGLGRTASVLLGATALQVATHATCPVLVTPRSGHWSAVGPVVVGVDASEHSVPAVEYAFAEAAIRQAELVPVHTWWWEEPDPFLAEAEWDDEWLEMAQTQELEVSELLAGWSEKYPEVTVRPTMVRGQAASVLAERSAEAQLLVVGSRGRGGFAGLLLGSVSSRVLHHSWCPVVVAPSAPRPAVD